MTATFERIKADRITPHVRNIRRDLGDLDELAASIKAQGVLQPLVVAPVPLAREEAEAASILPAARYVLIAGHRRHAAALKAGLETVPCIVRDDLDNHAKQLEAMLVENLQRTDLTVLEEADAYAQLELLGVKEAAIAKSTGRSRATVHQRLLLASLPTERREQYETGRLSLDGAVKCAKLREQWKDDSEILTAIDEQGTWAFSDGSYGIDRTIQRILDERNKPEESEPDEDEIDYAGTRAEQEAEWAQRDQERAERIAAHKAARDRMYDWLSGRIAARDDAFAKKLLDFAVEVEVQGGELDRILPLLGIDPCGEDEDVDDSILRITREAQALSAFDKTLLLALAASELSSEYVYLPDHAREMTSLGYTLTADDKALLPDEEN